MSTTQTEFAAALRTAIAAVNVHGLKVVRAEDVRAYGWPRSDVAVWYAELAAEVYPSRVSVRDGEVWLMVPC